MNIIVVGAGIAGLTAAISLRRAGHRVTIYERSSMNNEVGAAINVPPNATRFLLAWGLDPVRWGFVPGEKVTFQDPFTLEKGQEMLSKNAALEIGGAPLFYAHRVDLHSSLKDLATMTEGPGEPVKILLKQDVVAYVSRVFVPSVKQSLWTEAYPKICLEPHCKVNHNTRCR